MENKFFRRYRELEKYRMQQAPLDPTFEADRMEVLQAISSSGHTEIQPGAVMRAVAPPKYHGKMVRSKEYTADLRSRRQEEDTKRAAHCKRQHAIRQREEERKLTSELANSLKEYVLNHQSIPGEVISSSEVVKRSVDWAGAKPPQPAADVAPVKKTIQPELSITTYRQESTVFPKLTYSMPLQTIQHGRASALKWSQAERASLHALYQQMRPPHKGTKELLELYLSSFADKFLSHCPERSKEEVMDKVRGMLRRKQLKEVGEVEYWEQVRSNKHGKG